MSKPVNKVPVRFSIEQVTYLESLFPEVTSAGQSYGELQYRAGQRSVLNRIKAAGDVRIQLVQVQRNPIS